MPFLMQTEQQTQERRIVNPRRGRFDTEKSSGARKPTWNSTEQAAKMDGDGSNKQRAERTSLNEFQMLKFFKTKWKRFWIISLINIWANLAVTKHVLLADEFVPYRPRLLGFHSLHVNVMKCVYVGVFTVQTAVILLTNIFELLFNKARSTLYRWSWRKF